MPPNRSTSLDPLLQNRNKCALLDFTFVDYIKGNFGQTIWDKTQVLLGTSWGIWERLGNKGKQQKNPCSPHPFKKKKTELFRSAI